MSDQSQPKKLVLTSEEYLRKKPPGMSLEEYETKHPYQPPWNPEEEGRLELEAWTKRRQRQRGGPVSGSH